MSELTTDQRLSSEMLPMLAGLQEGAGRHAVNGQVLREHSLDEAAKVQEVVEVRVQEMASRLGEIIEALAAGTLRIVDEAAVVRLLAVEFEVSTAIPDTTRRAELALQQLQFGLAIR